MKTIKHMILVCMLTIASFVQAVAPDSTLSVIAVKALNVKAYDEAAQLYKRINNQMFKSAVDRVLNQLDQAAKDAFNKALENLAKSQEAAQLDQAMSQAVKEAITQFNNATSDAGKKAALKPAVDSVKQRLEKLEQALK